MTNDSDIVYQDKFITLYAGGILVFHGYWFPLGSARNLKFSNIESIIPATESPVSAFQTKSWGMGLAWIWWTLDWGRTGLLLGQGMEAINSRTCFVKTNEGWIRTIGTSCENVREFIRQAQRLGLHVVQRNHVD
jgi:hypothetical protein